MKELFKVPDSEQRKIALGNLSGLPSRLRKSIQSIADFFEPISQPLQGDWLDEHHETGQTYAAYKEHHNKVDHKRNTIYIRPLQKIDKEFLHQLQTYCECFFYPITIKIAKELESLKGVSQSINPETGKPHYNAGRILEILQATLPADAYCMIGVTMTDIYHREKSNFVFGLASIRNRTGVFSLARYDNRFFSMKQYEVDYNLIKYRSMAVMGHQISHMFGLKHCIYSKCLMNGSNSLEESMKKPFHLCVVCLRKLQSNLQFDILERYIRLLEFFNLQKDERVNKEIDFLEKAIVRIEESLKK